MTDEQNVPPERNPGPGKPSDHDSPVPPPEPEPSRPDQPVEPKPPKSGKQPEEPGSVPEDPPPEQPPSPGPEDDHLGERDERRYLDRIDDEERDWSRRQQNLRDLDEEDATVRAGGDATVGNRFDVSGGSLLYSIGGDAKIYQAGADRAPRIRYVSRSDVRQLKKCLVESPSQAELTEMTDRKTLIFLRGVEGTGRFTAAFHALLAWVEQNGDDADRETTQVGEILATGLPSHHAPPDLLKHHAYILDATNIASIRDLGALAQTIKDRADKIGCRVIVIVSADRSDLPGQIVEHHPPAAPKVFRCWLEYEAAEAGVDTGPLDELRQEIDEDLYRENSPRQAIDLVRRLVAGLKAGRTLDELRAELPQQLRDGIRGRLDGEGPVLGRCFMTSAAVLNGLPETTVSAAALAFAEEIKKIRSVQHEGLLPAWEQLNSWLDYAAATTSPAQIAGSGRLVHLKRRAETVTLRVLWEDQPTIREPLIAWLKGLAEDVSQLSEVQMKAAHAAGILATFDFDVARARFLNPWIKSRKLRDHRSAAMMLESTFRNPDMRPRVYELLRKLPDGTRGEQLAAAHAYGSPVGLNAPGIALRDLRKIAFGRNTEVSKAVAGSIGNLYARETAEEILKELESWLHSRSTGGLYTSALAFVRLARISSGNPAYPPLIELDASEVLFARLSALWHNALSLRVVAYHKRGSELAAPDSWTILARWVSRYEEDLVIRAVIDDIFHTANNGAARLRDSLRLNLWQWERRRIISKDLYGRLTQSPNI